MSKLKRQQQLLIRLAEECSEVSQRVSKALLFGLFETQEGQPLDNSERLNQEIIDLEALIIMLRGEGYINPSSIEAIEAKKLKVEKYIKYSDEMLESTDWSKHIK